MGRHLLECRECKRELADWRKQWAMAAQRYIRSLKERCNHGTSPIHRAADSQAPEGLDTRKQH